MIITYKKYTKYLLNDYDAAKKNNELKFTYNSFEVSEKSTNKI